MVKLAVDKIVGKEIREFSGSKLREQVKQFSQVVIDLGTGDGKFAYNYALEHPEAFVIGIDADGATMIETSRKASRKGSRGGVPNLMFVRAAAEELPPELDLIADKVFINFPWGSLLAGVVSAESKIMNGMVNMLRPRGGGQMQITLSYNAKFEPQMMTMYQLPTLKTGLGEVLANKYQEFGLKVTNWRELDTEEKFNFPSSWPKRILSRRDRPVWQLNCELIKDGHRK